MRPHGAGAMNKRKNKKMKKPRLTDSDRLAIETGLRSGKTVYMIAKELSRPVTTVTRERVNREIYAATPHFSLDFRIRIYYNIRMQKKSSEKSRSRAEILAEIAALPPSVQGTISSYRCPRKNGPPAVYHNLQYTRGGRNHSFSIPVDKVSEFKAAVAAGRKLRDLVFELSLADANEIASSESPLKKNSRSSS